MNTDKDTYDVNTQLMEKVYLLTIKNLEAHNVAEEYKRQYEAIEKELQETTSAKETSENKELLEETFCKLEQVVDLNESLEKENEELSAKVSVLEISLSVIEQKFVENEEIREKLMKEIVILKERAIMLEDENELKANAVEDMDMLKNKLHDFESENKVLKEKLAKTELEWTKIVDENIGLKLDLDDKNNEHEKLSKKLKETEKKVGTLQHFDKNATGRAVVHTNPPNNQQHQIGVLNNHLYYLNQQYFAVCQERDALRAHFNANQEHSRAIIFDQHQELLRLKVQLDNANARYNEQSLQSSIEDVAENHKKLLEQLNQIKASMGINVDKN